MIRIGMIAVAMSTLAAAAAAAEPKTVEFRTCTRPGVEKGCLVAPGKDGKIYNVTGLPGVKKNYWLQGSGVVVDKVSYCMQGPVIGSFTPSPQQDLIKCMDAPAAVGAIKPKSN